MKSFFEKADKIKPVFDIAYEVVLDLCKIMLIVQVVLATIMVGGRYIFHNQPPWCSEIILTLMIYLTMLSSALALRNGSHIRMTSFDRFLPQKLLTFLDFLADLLVFAFSIIMITQGWYFASTSKGTYTTMPWLSKFWLYAGIPLAGVAICIFQIEALYNQIKAVTVKEDKE